MTGPHDLFVRYTFGHPERAAAELRAVLPAHVVSEVDWASLRVESGSVVDPELRESESDLVFTARLRTGHPVLLYVLLEHQSSVVRWMAFRMLRYVVRLLERWRQEHPESEVLPVIIPLVMFHGAEDTWTAPRRVEELFGLPDKRWEALVPRFEYLLDDLTAEREEALRARPGPPLARLAWLVLRYGRSEELARKLPEWVALFSQVQMGPEGAEHLMVLIRYLLMVGNKGTREAAGRVLNSVLGEQRAEELMRTYGEELEELIERGRQQGLARGREEGLEKGLEKGLVQGVSLGRAESILRILSARGVPVDEAARQRILSCTDMATLDRWFDKALNATTLSSVLDDLVQ